MKRARRSTLRVVALTAALAALGGAEGDAAAFDLTGTWVGRLTCTGFDGSRFSDKFPTTMTIVQTGATATMNLDDGAETFAYGGGTIAAATQPSRGEALFVECRTQPALGDFGEILRAQVSTTPKGGATFKATSLFQDEGDVFGTCRWSFKRTDAAAPLVTGCP